MNAAWMAALGSLAFAMALAGCTGQFSVDQTEPFRVQLEGDGQEVTVSDSDAEPQRVIVEACEETADPCDVEQVELAVEVTKLNVEDACTVKVTIQTEDGELLDEVDVVVGGSSNETTDDNMTDDGNETTNDTGGSDTTVVQNIVVDVRGAHNIVVLTQAVEGEADVNIEANKVSGHGNQVGDDSGSTTTMTTSNTTTGTSSYTMTST
jgi:uncharacterized OsmC-like protein